MKETQEFVDALVNTVAVGVTQFADGVQWTDLGAIIPASLAWNGAIEGIGGFREEMLNATVLDVDLLFDGQLTKLTDVGINDFLAKMILTELKGKYLLYAYIVKQKDAKEDKVKTLPRSDMSPPRD